VRGFRSDAFEVARRAENPHDRGACSDMPSPPTIAGQRSVSSAMRHSLRRWAIVVFALVLAEPPVPGLAAPPISRAGDDCTPGWYWNADLNQCVFWLPAANGPGGPGGPGAPGGPGGPGWH
jgi:hypothetical protein